MKLVQTRLGHASAVVTLRTYAHLWPGDDDKARTAVDGVLSGLRTDRGPALVVAAESPGQGT